MSGKTYAITGANRGLGLEFVRQLSTSSNTIIACVRSLSNDLKDLEALKSNASSGAKIHILECDTSSIPSIETFGKELDKTIGKDTQLDFLINNAGINAVPNQTSLTLGEKDLQEHISVNVIGPAKTVEAVLSHLQKGSTVVNMTSGLGSCGKGIVKCTAYSISKAAVNMLTVHQAGDEEFMKRGVKVICMDPGWVKTRMGGEGAILEPEESIGGMLKTIYKSENGKFYTYTGDEVPW